MLVEDNRKISWVLYEILYKTGLKYWYTTFPYASVLQDELCVFEHELIFYVHFIPPHKKSKDLSMYLR